MWVREGGRGGAGVGLVGVGAGRVGVTSGSVDGVRLRGPVLREADEAVRAGLDVGVGGCLERRAGLDRCACARVTVRVRVRASG